MERWEKDLLSLSYGWGAEQTKWKQMRKFFRRRAINP